MTTVAIAPALLASGVVSVPSDTTATPDGVDHGSAEVADPSDRRADRAAETDGLLDLERIASDLDGVDAALRRLDDGSYWTDEVTGEEIADAVLAADPIARRSR
jgi:RNA polymerase-binding transcription factor DksA